MIRVLRARRLFMGSLYIFFIVATAFVAPASGPAAAPAHGPTAPASGPAGFPFTNETLHYTVSWASGLGLGEAHLTATRGKSPKKQDEQWAFEFALDAAVPGFAVTDRYHSTASVDLCSMTFDKEFTHGSRKSHERIEFDERAGVAKRDTPGAGKSEVAISQCARDALTFLYYARRELGQGRVPPHEDILFGGAYQVRLEYTGEQTIKVNDKKSESDRVITTLKGPASEISFEMFFARDAARTPLLIRVPLGLGTFSLELAR
jgi:hypothetical protein